jgi:pyruvate,orthophosphate dikinase
MKQIHDVENPVNYDILLEVVKDYPGILSSTEPLVNELKRYPHNLGKIVSEIKDYALKTFYIHDKSEKGPEIIKTIIDIFFQIIDTSSDDIKSTAFDGLLFYIEKIIVDSNHDLSRYETLFRETFTKFNLLDEYNFESLISNPHQLKKLGQILLAKSPNDFPYLEFNNLLYKYFLKTYEFWLTQEDPIQWLIRNKSYVTSENEYSELEKILYPLSHENLRRMINHLNESNNKDDQRERLKLLIQLPGFMQIVYFYNDAMPKISNAVNSKDSPLIKSLYLLKLLSTEGLSNIHENVIRELNRNLIEIIYSDEIDKIKSLLSEVFNLFKKYFYTYPESILSCIHSIGNHIYKLENPKYIEWFSNKIIQIGFHYPQIQGITEEWQVRVNRAHLKNIRIWLELIENNPKWSKSLISALIINLRLCGIHVNDTDLFQKDVTKLLNSEIEPVYHLIKQLLRLFPVYFSDIGSEGKLREVSTEIDEITGRSDILIHFLRKQSHVESSSRVVEFLESIIKFWLTKDKAFLKEFLPEELYKRIKTSGSYIDDLNKVFNILFKQRSLDSVTGLLDLKDSEIDEIVKSINDISEREKKRALLAIKFYKLLVQKYRLNPQDIFQQLYNAQSIGLPNVESLVNVLKEGSIHQKIDAILNYLQLLKDIILSQKRFEPLEQIFRKRHIAVGIPSVYGMYHERKFDALALTLRLENLANMYFEDLINTINLKFITRATLFQIQKYANLFYRALQIDGISSTRIEHTLELLSVALDVRRFSFSQYIDIFKAFFDAVKDILSTYYSGVFKVNLKQIITQIDKQFILKKYIETNHILDESEMINRISEQFLRESVSTSFGLQQLDNFISKILNTLFEQSVKLDIQNLDLLMSYDPQKALSSIYEPNPYTNDRIHLGNKGYNLIKLSALGMPVPPGFIITTEVFRCRKAINQFKYVREHLEEGIKGSMRRLERLTSKRFGSPDNPLLVSVRSGGAISMPGMMISFLNVGINEEIIKGLIKQTGRPWFAWDCYRRFLQCWGMSFGIERDKFDAIMNTFKARYNVERKIKFTPEQMKEIAIAYRDTVRDFGIEIIDDPEKQLDISISQVFQSWFSEKARSYREILGISDNWGTAVIVQSMIYGNLDENSGTGVLFTRNPLESGDSITLWGDFALGAQGEDIVLGLVKTLPISREQKPYEDRTTEMSLEESFPELYNEIQRIVQILIYREKWDAQEIEFTFEGRTKDKLFILQTRDMTITKKERLMGFVSSEELYSSFLSRGIGVGGGALSGRVVFDLNEIKEFRDKEPDTPLILVRSDTVPDDIRHISLTDGLLTSRGGSTSHAAIIANRLGKTCVVGCNNLIVIEDEKICRLNQRIIKSGDFISIDGRNGSVYFGRHKVEEIKKGV